MADNKPRPTEIPGVVASEPEDEGIFQARMPFAWAGDAITMLALATSGRDIPQSLTDGIPAILYGAETVVGHAEADTPLGAAQVAAAQFAETIIRNMERLGYVEIDYTAPLSPPDA
jgi:hypothetical protein